MYRLQIAASYDLATMSFDALCNQSMSFHSKPLRRNAGEPDHQVHERLPAAAGNHHVPVSAGHLLGSVHVRHPGAARASLRGHPHGAFGRVRGRVLLHVQAHPAPERAGRECAEPALRRAVGFGGEHPGREDLWARGLRARPLRPGQPRGGGARQQAHVGVAHARHRDGVHHHRHHERGGGVHCGRQRLVRHHAGHAGWSWFTYTYTGDEPVQLHQQRPAALQPRVWRRERHDPSSWTSRASWPTSPARRSYGCARVPSTSGLGFWYTDSDTRTRVFDDLELHIPAGQRVGLVGASGAGKTTLTKLLLRLSDIQEGRILVDGQNIADTTQQSLRRQIAYVPQEALLFHRSIAENIAYGRPDATMEQIREAARQANALEFIERLPQGFDTVTGERGVKLSGGQRQRIAIARALLARLPGAGAGRGHERARLRERAAGAGRARHAHARAHGHRGGAPAVHRGQPRPHRGAGPTARWLRTAPTPSSSKPTAPTRTCGAAKREHIWSSKCGRSGHGPNANERTHPSGRALFGQTPGLSSWVEPSVRLPSCHPERSAKRGVEGSRAVSTGGFPANAAQDPSTPAWSALAQDGGGRCFALRSG